MNTALDTIDNSTDHYLTEFVRCNMVADHVPAWLQQLRQQAMQHFLQLGIPTTRDEDWKYTNVTAIAKKFIKKSEALISADTLSLVAGYLDQIKYSESRLVFVDGHFSPQLSALPALPSGVIVTSLAQAIIQHPNLVEKYLNNIAEMKQHAFTAFNTVFANDGLFVYLPRDAVLEQPLTCYFINTAQHKNNFNTVRNLMICEENSQASIVEHYCGLQGESYFANCVSELVLHDHAKINHYKIINENTQAFHIGLTQAQQYANSYFNSQVVTLNGSLVRSDTQVLFATEHAECELNGLYLTRQRQHVDHHTLVDHAHARGISREYYKGVLADQSRAVFNGKVIVRAGAQKTNAQQNNKNLLLSEHAEIDTKPQLEIYNDDVKCTHGATVGQLNDDALFYLRSRGINTEDARNMLIYAFVKEMLEKIEIAELREWLSNLL
jgi:Fe-S cluster assembly protein SufD